MKFKHLDTVVLQLFFLSSVDSSTQAGQGLMLLGTTDLCIFSDIQWAYVLNILSTGLKRAASWLMSIFKCESPQRLQPEPLYTHLVNIALCGRANPLTLCSLFNVELISLSGALFSLCHQ